ncbi:putative BSD domain-containing protein [Helianthus annuus]|nr:putative BSD domain-containing protein [Helianthus annuus]
MDFWQKARSFAEDAAKKSQELTKEAAKRSQEFTKEAAKRSQDFTIGSSKLSDIVSEASKRSKEIAAEASKKADLIKVEALKRADQIKAQIPSTSVAISQLVVDSSSSSSSATVSGLREFVKEITINTFRDFPLEDDSEMSDIPTISNVRQDLTKWQETHAKLVLSTVKEISKLRYELCPRVMRERKFWRIYFLLVNNHVTPYEKRYKEEEENKKVVEKVNEDATVGSAAESVSKTEASEANQKTKSTNTKTTDQDLDVFLLGDLGDSDEGPDDGNDDGLDDDDDFDKL